MGKGETEAYEAYANQIASLKGKLCSLAYVDIVVTIISTLVFIIYVTKNHRNELIFWMLSSAFHLGTIVAFMVTARRGDRINNIMMSVCTLIFAFVGDVAGFFARIVGFGTCDSCTTTGQLAATLLPFFLVICYLTIDIIGAVLLVRLYSVASQYEVLSQTEIDRQESSIPRFANPVQGKQDSMTYARASASPPQYHQTEFPAHQMQMMAPAHQRYVYKVNSGDFLVGSKV